MRTSKAPPVARPIPTAGTLLACDRFREAGAVLAYLIAGHHAGLDEWHGGLETRLTSKDARNELGEVMEANPPKPMLDPGDFNLDLSKVPGRSAGFALWVRMLLSALVAADFLDRVIPKNRS